ncbi:hypothetical protein DFQ01_11195 [Paenibacillus cellulosilyticus]|uniref:Uncharacterized protein n=1 Tax=Paenibacillus cellulosilyticus TaxID=375489 RepID=A0A2V2YS98_9BACL|nr:hypothetical protein [Paenibacillus cellulosilyticus]PWW00948.1 hypothetical protein DFQ01_11195 [Paenibacillus cellulosilyticus]QKS47596.1 hypothetical protein HUB94_24810 [Paenibacillus cellulosilyticus]
MNNNETTDPKQNVNQGKENNAPELNAQELNESGIDYIWGSDQDEYVRKEEKEE